jgi:hypothetical protein
MGHDFFNLILSRLRTKLFVLTSLACFLGAGLICVVSYSHQKELSDKLDTEFVPRLLYRTVLIQEISSFRIRSTFMA